MSLALIAFEWSTSPAQSSFVINSKDKPAIEDEVPLTNEKEKFTPPEVKTPDYIEILKNNQNKKLNIKLYHTYYLF